MSRVWRRRRVHPAVVNDLCDFVVFEKEFEPDDDGVGRVLVQDVEEEAVVRGGNLDEGDTAIAAKVDAFKIDGDGGEVVEGGEERGGGVVPVADDGGHCGWGRGVRERVNCYFYSSAILDMLGRECDLEFLEICIRCLNSSTMVKLSNRIVDVTLSRAWEEFIKM